MGTCKYCDKWAPKGKWLCDGCRGTASERAAVRAAAQVACRRCGAPPGPGETLAPVDGRRYHGQANYVSLVALRRCLEEFPMLCRRCRGRERLEAQLAAEQTRRAAESGA